MARNENSILYVQTSNAPERQYSPLVLAQSAKAMGLDAAVYFLGMGLTVLKPGEAEKMQLGSFPSVAEMLQKTHRDGHHRLRLRGVQADARLGDGRADRRRQDRRRRDAQRPGARRRRHDVVLGHV